MARDIAGSDPERMSAPRIVKYLKNEFASAVEVVMEAREVDAGVYPLMAAVNRAASGELVILYVRTLRFRGKCDTLKLL